MDSRMSIGQKLYWNFGAALTLTMIVGRVSLQSIGSLGSSQRTIINQDARALFLASDCTTALSKMLSQERGIIRRADMKDTASVEKYAQIFQESAVRLQKRLEELSWLVNVPEGRAIVGQLQATFPRIASNHQEFMRLIHSDDPKAADAFLTKSVTPLLRETNDVPDKLLTLQEELMATKAKDAEGAVSRSRWIMFALIVLSLVIGAIIVFVVRQINGSLRRAITELSEGAGQVASAAAQVASSSQSLAQGSSEQAASLEQTSASTEEINSMARRNSENARSAASLVSQAQQNFVETNQSLQQTVVAMGEINTQSGKISKIIKVIDEIAFQTNILALNAAVEALVRVRPAWDSSWSPTRSATWRSAARKRPGTRRS
jgi:methyl-accepting chemotaxis protein